MSAISNSGEKRCIRCGEAFIPWNTGRGLYIGYYCGDCHEERTAN